MSLLFLNYYVIKKKNANKTCVLLLILIDKKITLCYYTIGKNKHIILEAKK